MTISLNNLKNSVQTVTAKNEQFLLQNVRHKAEYCPDMRRATNRIYAELAYVYVQK